MEEGQQRLLGRLAELSWFTANGEVAATRSVAMLLEHDRLRAATLSDLHARTGVDVTPVIRFLAEQVHADGARPDVEGLDVADRPLVMVEAKFGAVMNVTQLRAYLADQSARLTSPGADDTQGIFVLLVPEKRVAEAKFRVRQAFLEQAELGSSYRATPLVLTWSELLDLWDGAVSSEPPSPDSVPSDIVQLRAMCLALGGLVIAPLGPAAAGAAWRSREDEYRVITDEVTRALSGSLGLMPIGDEGGYIARRYFPSGLVAEEGRPQGWAAVGVQTEFADAGASPIWLRFHRRTPRFSVIRDRVLASGHRAQARRDEGHLWLPLHVDPDLGGPDLVADLVAQVNAVRKSLAR